MALEQAGATPTSTDSPVLLGGLTVKNTFFDVPDDDACCTPAAAHRRFKTSPDALNTLPEPIKMTKTVSIPSESSSEKEDQDSSESEEPAYVRQSRSFFRTEDLQDAYHDEQQQQHSTGPVGRLRSQKEEPDQQILQQEDPKKAASRMQDAVEGSRRVAFRSADSEILASDDVTLLDATTNSSISTASPVSMGVASSSPSPMALAPPSPYSLPASVASGEAASPASAGTCRQQQQQQQQQQQFVLVPAPYPVPVPAQDYVQQCAVMQQMNAFAATASLPWMQAGMMQAVAAATANGYGASATTYDTAAAAAAAAVHGCAYDVMPPPNLPAAAGMTGMSLALGLPPCPIGAPPVFPPMFPPQLYKGNDKAHFQNGTRAPPLSLSCALPAGPVPQTAAGGEAAGSCKVAGGKTRGKRGLRLWCHMYLHMQVEGFDLVPRLIGRGGQNLRRIAEATDSKIRVRGRGSGHLEADTGCEAPTPLMVAITTDKADIEKFRSALTMVLHELHSTAQKFDYFLAQENLAHQGPYYSVGLLTEGIEHQLADVLCNVPFAAKARRDWSAPQALHQ